MRVITIANQKGGIGKTTTAVALASTLRKKGYKTLLIDADVQCNSTDTYRAQTEGVATLYDLVVEDEPCPVEEAIQHTASGDIIAADPGLEEAERKLNSADMFFKIQDVVKSLEGTYDFIIIDTNPSVNRMLQNSITAATEVIIPITADRYSFKGLSQLTMTIKKIQQRLNPKLRVSGLLLVKFDERAILNRDLRASLDDIAQKIGTKVFKTYIRQSVKCREAQAVQMTMLEYAPMCTTQQDYESFVSELLDEEVK